MSVPVKRISKVIIAGQWYSVRLGEFEIVEMEFTDDGGNALHAEPLGGSNRKRSSSRPGASWLRHSIWAFEVIARLPGG